MEALFARHRTSVYRWLVRFVNDAPLAEDLLSEVFLDVWRQAGRFEGRSIRLYVAYVYSPLQGSCGAPSRRQRRLQVDEHIEATVADASDDPETALAKKDPE